MISPLINQESLRVTPPVPGQIQIVDNNANVISNVPGLERIKKMNEANARQEIVVDDQKSIAAIVEGIRHTQSIFTASMMLNGKKTAQMQSHNKGLKTQFGSDE